MTFLIIRHYFATSQTPGDFAQQFSYIHIVNHPNNCDNIPPEYF